MWSRRRCAEPPGNWWPDWWTWLSKSASRIGASRLASPFRPRGRAIGDKCVDEHSDVVERHLDRHPGRVEHRLVGRSAEGADDQSRRGGSVDVGTGDALVD